MQAFVPKNRKPRFDFILRVIDLNNVPLVNGTAYVKWRVPSSSATENHGHTDKAVIIDHRAQWNYKKSLQIRLTIDKNQVLQECEIQFEVIQEFASGTHGERNMLGQIRLNLAEYADKSDDEEGIMRRYLMQDSKINSTLKLGVVMRQIEGERSFSTPPLRSAMVFGGIAGVVSTEQGETDGLGQVPSINTKSNEVADMQDIYRRTLAASWSSRVGDPPADRLIEGLFSGSSTLPSGTQSGRAGQPAEDNNEISSNDTDSRRTVSGDRLSPSFERQRNSPSSATFSSRERSPDLTSAVSRTKKHGSTEQQLYDNVKGKTWQTRSPSYELTEFDVREDLRSWEVSAKE